MKIEVDQTLSALADPTRRRVLELLGSGPKAAGELARELAMSPPAMSRHLRILRQSSLVHSRMLPQDVRVRMYELAPARLSELGNWLRQLESFWLDQLDSFKDHVEQSHSRGDS